MKPTLKEILKPQETEVSFPLPTYRFICYYVSASRHFFENRYARSDK